MSGQKQGRVILVGAGPGAPDLVTLRGERALRSADVVLHDALVSPELLSLAPPGCRLIDIGRRGHEGPARSREAVIELLLENARAGNTVVRLKGGDPYVFGRGAEEAGACSKAGIPFEVVPGISSALGGLAYAGIPVTDRRYAASFAVVTGSENPRGERGGVNWEALASSVDTLVVLMGMRALEEITARLLAAGRSSSEPAAAVMSAATPAQRSVVATLGTLSQAVRESGLSAPGVVVVGEVVRLSDELAWFTKLPLFGRRILVTRAREQAGEWCRTLSAAGAEPVPCPMIRIEAVRAAPGLAEALAQLADFDFLLLTSANAARQLAARACEAGVSLSALRGQVYTVGEVSAAAAAEVGLSSALLHAAGGSAAVLLETLRARGDLAGKKIFLPRAERGREHLARGLSEAGAQVQDVVVYRTTATAFDAQALGAELSAGALDALTFASPSAVRNFAERLGPLEVDAARRAVVAAIGPVTAEACAQQGLGPDVTAAAPSAAELVRALEAHFVGVAEASARAGEEKR